MQGISLKLLIGKISHNHGRESHETGSLVLLDFTPAVTLLSLLHAVGWEVRYNEEDKMLASAITRIGIFTNQANGSTYLEQDSGLA